jgi:hypothetical protein
MYCERCEGRMARSNELGTSAFVAGVWGAQQLGGLLCMACGALLSAEGFAERLLRKHLQLARFGLVSAAGPLLETTKGDGA